jgi:catechol 2,3-dioxygenase-like lactoylglutathione lyase family enzyme
MRYLHTMIRSADLARTQTFLEALGYERTREAPQFREGVQEATNSFFRLPGDSTDVEVQVPADGDVPELEIWGHVSLGVEDIDATLLRLADHGIIPDAPPYQIRDGGPRLCLLTEPAGGHVFELVETG